MFRSRLAEDIDASRFCPQWHSAVMPTITGTEATHVILRWFHFMAGITWVGLLYFFNLVNVPFMKQVDAAAKPKILQNLTLPALNWFRWSSLVTVFVGFWYWGQFLVAPDAQREGVGQGSTFGLFFAALARRLSHSLFRDQEDDAERIRARGSRAILVYAAGWIFVNYTPVGGDDNHVLCIGVGGGMGIVMMFNVWGIIWPNNKKIIRGTLAGTPPANAAAAGAPGIPGVADEFLPVGAAAVLHGRSVALLQHSDLREVSLA